MKIYVSVDMEGIGGIVLPDQLRKGEFFYQEGRQLLTNEVNAIVDALLEAGATDIVVKDAHATGFNFVPELLRPGATYLMGGTPIPNRFAGLDSTFDGAFLIGYHGMAGARRAVRDHTFSSASFQYVKLNGREVGEIALDSHLIGVHGVPVLLVTGDDAACREAKEELEGVAVYETKQAAGRHAALLKAPQQVRQEMREAVRAALAGRGGCKPRVIPGPYELEIRYTSTDMADGKYCDGVRSERLDGQSVLHRDDDLVRLLARAL
ncbi:M55 family metallopeptidase [Paenibacillus sp. GYB003]|uniref:M55 family metallopeptidase n=1 Tax=Paenibacillus sp. GYB003 TaxID=2994392 RepID=UPI002F96684C